MESKKLTLYSRYKLGQSNWKEDWASPAIGTNKDANRFYVGGESDKRKTKLRFTIGSDLVVGSSKRIILKITGDSEVYPKYMRAYLLTSDPSYQDTDSTIIARSIEMSYLYLDTSKSKQATSYQSAPVPMYAIFDKTKFEAGKTYYVFLLPFTSNTQTSPTYDGTWLRAQNKESACTVTFEYESYSKVGNPVSPTVTNQIYRDGSIKMAWGAASNGTNNPVAKYRVYYEINSQPTASSRYLETTATSLTTKNSDIGNTSKGNKIYFAVQAIGNISGTIAGFDSSLVQAGYCSVINKGPVYPTFDVEGVILTSQPETRVTVKNIRGSSSPEDVDGDTITYYYKVSSQETLTDFSNGTPIVSGDQVAVSETNKYIFIWSSDGTERSGAGRKTVSINSRPIINSIAISGENILNKNGQSCTRYLSASASISKTVSKYEWYFFDYGYLNYVLIGEAATLNKISIESFPYYGGRIQLKLVVTDSAGETAELISDSSLYQMAPPISSGQLVIRGYENDTGLANGTVNSKYINNKINIYLTLPTLDPKQIPLKSLEVWAASEGRNTRIFNGGVSEGESQYTISYDFEHQKDYTFAVKVLDNADRIIELSSPNVFQKLPLINLSQAQNQTSQREWHVLRRQGIMFSTLYADNSNTGNNTYRIEASVNNGGYITLLQFDSSSANTTISGNTLTHMVPDDFELFKVLRVKTNEPNYRVSYRIIASNAFGEEGGTEYYGWILDCAIVTREAPTFNTSTNFYTRVGYIKDPTNILAASFNEIPSATTGREERMFNPGELIDFCLTELATDLNSLYYDGKQEFNRDTIPSYEVDYASSSITISNPSSASLVWNSLGVLGGSAQWSEDSDFYHQSLIVPQFSTPGSYVYFRISAIDDSGKRSEYKYCLQPLICCRKVTPAFSIAEVKKERTSMTISLSVSDWGGNNKGYENFFRKGSETATITVEYGSSLNENLKTETQTALINELPTEVSFDMGAEPSGKIYFHVSIRINTNIAGGDYNAIIAIAPTYIYYSEGPTVSYRSHWVGINNNVFEPDEVMRIEAFKKGEVERHMMRFVGFDSDSNSNIVVGLDLNSGKIAGLIINGGSWD